MFSKWLLLFLLPISIWSAGYDADDLPIDGDTTGSDDLSIVQGILDEAGITNRPVNWHCYVEHGRVINLALDAQNITSIPSSVSKLKKLKYLSAHSNKLTDLPAELAELPELEILDIRGNNFERIPQVVFSCNKLGTLEVDYNYLPTLPSEIMTTNIKRFTCWGNKLCNLSDTLTQWINTSYTSNTGTNNRPSTLASYYPVATWNDIQDCPIATDHPMLTIGKSWKYKMVQVPYRNAMERSDSLMRTITITNISSNGDTVYTNEKDSGTFYDAEKGMSIRVDTMTLRAYYYNYSTLFPIKREMSYRIDIPLLVFKAIDFQFKSYPVDSLDVVPFQSYYSQSITTYDNYFHPNKGLDYQYVRDCLTQMNNVYVNKQNGLLGEYVSIGDDLFYIHLHSCDKVEYDSDEFRSKLGALIQFVPIRHSTPRTPVGQKAGIVRQFDLLGRAVRNTNEMRPGRGISGIIIETNSTHSSPRIRMK